MIVQIYSLTHPDDVRLLVELGVDQIGLAPAGQGLRSELSLEESRALFGLLPPDVLSAALTVRTDLDAIVAMAEAVKPAIVHICSATEALSVEAQHFVECVQRGERPLSDGEAGLRVVRILEAATESLAGGGRPVELRGEKVLA